MEIREAWAAERLREKNAKIIEELTRERDEARAARDAAQMRSNINLEKRREVEAQAARLRAALERAIKALDFADTPESKGFHFYDLTAQLRQVLANTPAASLESIRAEAKGE